MRRWCARTELERCRVGPGVHKTLGAANVIHEYELDDAEKPHQSYKDASTVSIPFFRSRSIMS